MTVGSGDAYVAGQRQLQPAAQRIALHGAQHQLVRQFQQTQRPVPVVEVGLRRLSRGQFLQINAGAESPPSSTDDDRPRRRVVVDCLRRLVQLHRSLEVDGVQYIGTVQRQPYQVYVALVKHRFQVHGSSLRGTRCVANSLSLWERVRVRASPCFLRNDGCCPSCPLRVKRTLQTLSTFVGYQRPALPCLRCVAVAGAPPLRRGTPAPARSAMSPPMSGQLSSRRPCLPTAIPTPPPVL